ncbi:mediator of RNA polymerase II transcription subunit 30-like isoform X2 [Vespa mandarinia]|uniref:mediator of RNA polymerase II transcription subunit 30-like isoform X2 n=1 Tax=Vespa mandarinia TaxID=7446 RepID=UPI0016112E6E|nr:mediator of RNA polymerase II transcription subunit 30-like isoform X2 [Vespa mandarinia]XP_043671475.1 mediator of RNA polymerase II transcription subunit 30 isoform X2 [Vespula pensylvanica]XP_046818407.1 mediator of RNA polymerase II transcription subunit 30 isoform X2 [Vespa crabro]XP_047354061.1 mediator of RNA polymerase II transcription subunit 30-like isoform X2 [Vespa velutina]XP_050853036.1 mediator of RNA polymerase II transcription subunit 30 isoform X2 [Vespula vulgaris]
MAGQQHPFPSGFPNVQQSAMRTQFGGGQMVSGLMGPQQGIVSPQQFGVGVGVGVGVGGVGSNAMGMPNAQQVLAQQQQQQQSVAMQQQMQQMQQQQLQLQQQQQAALVQQSNQTSNQATTPQTPVPPTQPPPQQQQNKDFNTASLCRFGQETVQDIVSRTLDVFQTLKVLQPPNGTPQGASVANDKKTKVQEQLRMLKLLFKRLRLIYEKCNENCQLQGMEYTHIESLIPLKEEWDMKSDEKKTSEAYRLAYEESKEITEQVVLKNRHLKEIIDHLRRIISEINTMLNMRRS